MPIDEYDIGNQIGALSQAVKNVSEDIHQQDKKLDAMWKAINKQNEDRVTHKELNEVKEEVAELKSRMDTKEKIFGIVEALRVHWRFLVFVFGLCTTLAFAIQELAHPIHSLIQLYEITKKTTL